MEIIRHYHQEDVLQRSTVKEGHSFYRRIARFVKPDGEICEERLESPVWQEETPNRDFQTVMDPARAALLEREFVEQIIIDSRSRG